MPFSWIKHEMPHLLGAESVTRRPVKQLRPAKHHSNKQDKKEKEKVNQLFTSSCHWWMSFFSFYGSHLPKATQRNNAASWRIILDDCERRCEILMCLSSKKKNNWQISRVHDCSVANKSKSNVMRKPANLNGQSSRCERNTIQINWIVVNVHFLVLLIPRLKVGCVVADFITMFTIQRVSRGRSCC